MASQHRMFEDRRHSPHPILQSECSVPDYPNVQTSMGEVRVTTPCRCFCRFGWVGDREGNIDAVATRRISGGGRLEICTQSRLLVIEVMGTMVGSALASHGMQCLPGYSAWQTTTAGSPKARQESSGANGWCTRLGVRSVSRGARTSVCGGDFKLRKAATSDHRP